MEKLDGGEGDRVDFCKTKFGPEKGCGWRRRRRIQRAFGGEKMGQDYDFLASLFFYVSLRYYSLAFMNICTAHLYRNHVLKINDKIIL